MDDCPATPYLFIGGTMNIDIGKESWEAFKLDAIEVMESINLDESCKNRAIDDFFSVDIIEQLKKYGLGENSTVLSLMEDHCEELKLEELYSRAYTSVEQLKDMMEGHGNEIYDIALFIDACCRNDASEQEEGIQISLDGEILKGDNVLSTDATREAYIIDKRNVELFKNTFLTITEYFQIATDSRHSILEEWLNSCAYRLYTNGTITQEQMDSAIAICEEIDDTVDYVVSKRQVVFEKLHETFDSYNRDDPLFNLRGLIDCIYIVIPEINKDYSYRCGDLVSATGIVGDNNIICTICGIADKMQGYNRGYIVRPLKRIGEFECYLAMERDLQKVILSMSDDSKVI